MNKEVVIIDHDIKFVLILKENQTWSNYTSISLIFNLYKRVFIIINVSWYMSISTLIILGKLSEQTYDW